ncbi:MAG TPA: NAD(P)-dependent oxidoreductase [Actinocrinis sp.]|nr:NAD(P)-dependent oxidoreductase [Actinocrinis sp.]
MSEPGTILVGDDHALGDVFASVAEALRRRGHRVVRAPAAAAPQHTVFRPDEWHSYFGEAELALISSRTVLSADLLGWAPRLHGVVFGSIGTSSCDQAAANQLGILVANGATDENIESMAEANVMLAAALLLELMPKRQWFDARLPRPASHEIESRMLAGKTVGFVGFGRIAQQTLRRLAGWRVGRVLAVTRTPRPDQWPQVEFTDLVDLLRASDVVIVGLPLNNHTRGIIGRSSIQSMRQGGVLINTARGGLVDEVALAQALESGHLAAAAVDTFAEEPPPPDHPLRRAPNVILTGHIVGHTADLFASLVPAALDNIESLLAGRPPRYLVNPDTVSAWHARRARLAAQLDHVRPR